MQHPTLSLLAALSIPLLGFGPLQAVGAANEEIPLWPKKAPGDHTDIGKERARPGNEGNVIRLENVSDPTLTFFPAPADNNSGTTVVVFPGGGYYILAMNLEGTEIADWLNSIGVNAVLVKYRVPRRPNRARHDAPLQDAQRAMGLVRQHAADWDIDPNRIGVIGFSAGGHLCAALSNNYRFRTYPTVDAADDLSCRPDFTLLIYPAYLTIPEHGDAIAPELPVSSDTPPTFIVETQDDNVRVETAVFYYLALKNAGVPTEMHLYATGGHGYGLRPAVSAVTQWPELATTWMQSLNLLGNKKE